MPRKILKRFFPSAEAIRTHKSLQLLGSLIHEPDLWHLHQRCVATAFFIGIFIAFIPTPGQMLIAALLALLFRANLLISVVLTWITNPFTTPAIAYFNYRIGSWLLHQSYTPVHFEFSIHWIVENLTNIGIPFLFGSLVCGLILGALSYGTIRIAWRWHVSSNWQKRKHRRATQQH